jgi:hypothetical protein
MASSKRQKTRTQQAPNQPMVPRGSVHAYIPGYSRIEGDGTILALGACVASLLALRGPARPPMLTRTDVWPRAVATQPGTAHGKPRRRAGKKSSATILFPDHVRRLLPHPAVQHQPFRHLPPTF